jgi:hypothetical protein
MRRFRKQTNETAARLGRPIRIAVQVSGDWGVLSDEKFGARAVSMNFMYGFDIGTWAKERLVDVISPSFRRDYRPMFLEHVLDELGDGRNRIELVPSIGQHHDGLLPKGYNWAVYFTDVGVDRRDLIPFGELDPWRVLREAHDLYRQGVDSVDVWEMGHAPVRLSRWNILKHVGNRDLLTHEFGERIDGLMGKVSQPRRFLLK